MATVLKTETPAPAGPAHELKWVGKRPIRPDGVDKVTGRAKFGADLILPGMLVGKVLRSPLPHARIKSIDVSKAAALPGVKAVVTRDDFHDLPSEFVPAGEMLVNYRDMVRNVMAREKVLYEGHAGGGGGRDQRPDREAGAEADRGRVRAAAARHRRGRGDAGRCAPAARRPLHGRRRAGAREALERRQAGRVRDRRHRRRALPRPTSSSSASSTPSRSTRATSSPMPASRASPRTARPSSGARPRGITSSAPTAPSCSAWRSRRSG